MVKDTTFAPHFGFELSTSYFQASLVHTAIGLIHVCKEVRLPVCYLSSHRSVFFICRHKWKSIYFPPLPVKNVISPLDRVSRVPPEDLALRLRSKLHVFQIWLIISLTQPKTESCPTGLNLFDGNLSAVDTAATHNIADSQEIAVFLLAVEWYHPSTAVQLQTQES